MISSFPSVEVLQSPASGASSPTCGPAGDSSACIKTLDTGVLPHGHHFMFRRCMYCRTIFGTKPCGAASHEQTTDGVCTICAAFYYTSLLGTEFTL